jgi:NAD(P)-dependent dehydrogenase (short-subunit alcohol dehydrogenase family)
LGDGPETGAKKRKTDQVNGGDDVRPVSKVDDELAAWVGCGLRPARREWSLMVLGDSLDGMVALVTGGGRGIGRSVAIRLAARGAEVVLAARSAEELDETVALIEAAGGRGRPVQVDLADPEGPTRLASEAGQVDGIVAGPSAMVGGTVYVATKAALEAHTVNLAAELDGTGVTVNVYRPGTVDTAMQAHIRGQDPDRVGARLVDRFVQMRETGQLASADDSGAGLVDELLGPETGAIWTFERR